ncbi:MAG: recombinase family protein [Alphaproteobacteria bacterium]|nr:recombinase family protein [Alphaproteobacteria bacterium]
MTIVDFPKHEAQRAVILTRVSSKEQEEGHSIDAQKHRLQVYCQRRALEVVRVFEITESSTRGDRAKFMEMIAFIKSQRGVIALVADKVDRVQRSFKEYPLLDSLIQDGKLELHFNTENYVIHKGSISQERMMWSFGVIMAQSYTDSLRDNVKRSQDHMIRAGLLPGMSPIGYLNTRDASGKAQVIIDDQRAPIVRRMFEEFATGTFTLAHMTEMAQVWGLRNKTKRGGPLHRSHVYLILTNAFYHGIMTVKGKQHPHTYPALIDRQLFDRCQAVLKNWEKKPFKYGTKEFIFRSLLTCANTGRTVSALQKKKTYLGGGSGEWTYLRTWDKSGKLVYIPEQKVLEQAESALQGLYMPPDIQQAISDHLRTTERSERDFQRRQGDELKKEHTRIQARIDGLMDLLMDKAIDREDFDRRRTEFRSQRQEIEGLLTAHREGDDGFKDSLLFLLDICSSAAEVFQGSTIEEKRQFLNFTLENLTLDGAKLSFSYRKPFCWFAEEGRVEKWSD